MSNKYLIFNIFTYVENDLIKYIFFNLEDNLMNYK